VRKTDGGKDRNELRKVNRLNEVTTEERFLQVLQLFLSLPFHWFSIYTNVSSRAVVPNLWFAKPLGFTKSSRGFTDRYQQWRIFVHNWHVKTISNLVSLATTYVSEQSTLFSSLTCKITVLNFSCVPCIIFVWGLQNYIVPWKGFAGRKRFGNADLGDR
jgi:hypothetical protein